jgi:phosphoenolpyruvate carboxylase
VRTGVRRGGAADEWQALCSAFARFSRRIDPAHTVNINASSLRKAAKDVAQQYFRQTRPVLQDLALGQQLEGLNAGFQSLLELSERNSAKSSYKKYTTAIRKLMPKVTSQIELAQGIVTAGLTTTEEDDRIIQTLQRLVPSAALSYKQSIIDLADAFLFAAPHRSA